jgi:hypothetical protein
LLASTIGDGTGSNFVGSRGWVCFERVECMLSCAAADKAAAIGTRKRKSGA